MDTVNVDLLHFDVFNLICTIINLLVLYWLMMKFLFKPIRKVIAQRNAEIDATYQDIKTKTEEAQSKNKEADARLAEIEQNRKEAVRKAKREANEVYDSIIADAKKQSDEILEEARHDTKLVIMEEKQKAKEEISTMIEDASLKISNEKSDQELYDKFLKEMDE
ncbi:ATP synthase F0 subunit B [Catenisphaera adipataccumulans]|jgi:F-type H+-transporting ATPase subunit b|uniref:ATP synthase subunit b n=1 Tax=Catenisphaera adipataccumulans TaxID=700500 RepID=A0A7W8FV00_9FIRM|nr:ATP synthase F0 subunit B [Catenisphaera adipataccumulans]MBB5183099.1 F-type H+-transporting ATPase subunit b [Catenisphaera adipataccumulans]